MKSNKPTTTFIIDTRREKADKTYPVKFRVIYNRQNRLFGTAYSLNAEVFKKVMGKSPREPYKALRLKLNDIEKKANDIIESMPVFTFDDFSDRYLGKVGEPENVFTAFQSYINEMNKAERVGNAIAYRCAMNSLKDFYSKEKLTFDEVDIKFIKKYDVWATMKGNNKTTIGIYLRCVRALYNNAIRNGGAKVELYPFGRGKYEIPAPQNIKKALTLKDIEKIFKYHPETNSENLYRDLWIFSYLCNGANMKDICLLKYKDVSENTIQFRRAKTSNTSRKSKPIVVGYSNQIKKIISKWGNKPQQEEIFIFPFLQIGFDEKNIKNKVADVVKLVNKYINRIAQKCEIVEKVTTYTARHSFATTLKRSGVNVSFISEAMGHADIKTTESYLGSIEDTDRNRIADLLTKFPKVKKMTK